MEQAVYEVRIPWGTFGRDAHGHQQWKPNPLLPMNADEQRRQNEQTGYLEQVKTAT
jgi:hypothetical protein